MKSNSKSQTALLALAAALPLTAGLVFAAGTSTNPQRVQPAQPEQQGQGTQSGGQTPSRQRQSSGTNYADLFLQRLAAGLGITVERLRAAAVAAGNATIDQAVRNGDIPEGRAADLKARLQDAPLNFGRFGGRGHMGRGGPDGRMDDRGPRAGFGRAIAAAVARTLGLSEQALVGQLQSGQTVRQIAQARGVSTQTVHNAAVAALRTSLAAEEQAGRLSQAQAQQLLARAQADENFGLNFGHAGHGYPGRDGQGTPRAPTQPNNPGNTTPGTQGS
ncbi:hypothetical protein DAETH_14400 [Deinococcus aetherius]|uniref:Uncharacterized protein n=1 Tax=Deinococcus aetherius TaxID=200252 RepID=A0ABM8ACM8_9DEIO|nr:hypothetical protein DAETH_14400 [Deinococcus aetherius]